GGAPAFIITVSSLGSSSFATGGWGRGGGGAAVALTIGIATVGCRSSLAEAAGAGSGLGGDGGRETVIVASMGAAGASRRVSSPTAAPNQEPMQYSRACTHAEA